MKSILFFGFLILVNGIFANDRIVYKYKKYQKFDFEEIKIDGETDSPGDLSISPRFIKSFKNKLPYRKNFSAEMRKGIERIK